jgi:MFS family permease
MLCFFICSSLIILSVSLLYSDVFYCVHHFRNTVKKKKSFFFNFVKMLRNNCWGKLADVYGRKFAIILSFALCSIFSLFFGFSRSWKCAILSRFLCGISGGITGVMTTALSEASHEDAELETKGFGLFVGRWIWGLMVAPAIGGMLAEPFEQYPLLLQFISKDTFIYQELTSVPFALPNIFGAVLCWTSIVFVAVACNETLPRSQLREANQYFLPDIFHRMRINIICRPWKLFKRLISYIPIYFHTANFGYTQINDNKTEGNGSFSSTKVEGNDINSESAAAETSEDLKPEDENNNLIESFSQQEEMEILSFIDFPGLLQWRSKANADAVRASIIVADVRSHAEFVNEEINPLLLPRVDQNIDITNKSPRSCSHVSGDDKHELATIKTIWANKPCRKHLLVFWIYGFVTVLVDGTFPLYCMSNNGGLGISEVRVGAILSLTGTIINFSQYHVYMYLLNRLGIKNSMIFGSLISVLLLAFIPLSVLLNENRRLSEGEQLTPVAFLFLVTVLAASRVFSSSVEASLLVSMHRTVLPSHRSTMNSLSALFASLGRAFGPLFAGSLVQHCFSLFVPAIGGFIIWIALAFSGVVSCAILMILLA